LWCQETNAGKACLAGAKKGTKTNIPIGGGRGKGGGWRQEKGKTPFCLLVWTKRWAIWEGRERKFRSGGKKLFLEEEDKKKGRTGFFFLFPGGGGREGGNPPERSKSFPGFFFFKEGNQAPVIGNYLKKKKKGEGQGKGTT